MAGTCRLHVGYMSVTELNLTGLRRLHVGYMSVTELTSTNTRSVNWHIVYVTRTVTTNALRTPTSKFVIRPRDLVISVD